MPETALQREPESLPVSELIGGRYRKIDQLGIGGMGEVWKVEDEQTGRELVMKVLHRDLATYEIAVERFKREIRAMGQIKNPFVVKAHDAILMKPETRWGEPQLGVIMEYVEGKDLFDTLNSERFFDEKRAAAVAIQICLALAGAHEAGIVHRDLKPENIFLDNEGRVRVGDFGIAYMANELAQHQLRNEASDVERAMRSSQGRALTTRGTTFGTPEYMSPEAGMGEQVDGRADLYALGVIMYRMLTGKLPFGGGKKNKLAVIHQQILERPKQFSELTMPGENSNTVLTPVVMKLLEKDRDE